MSQVLSTFDDTETGFLLDAYRQMALIRNFEQEVWDQSATQPPNVIGSVHFCAGQEAIPVGACAALDQVRDKIICTYRGHGWALAWGLDPGAVFAEICHRESGINGGRAGSALIMDPGSGFIGENSIVGAGAPVACGTAMALERDGKGGVVLISIGDGAMNQGATHEAIVFAVARSLPVIFVCENNGWSEMTATEAIVPIDRLSKRGSGYGLPSATVDGNDPIAVRDTIIQATERARKGKGPSLIEFKTTRLWGHYNRDIEHYRSKEDRERAAAADPLPRLRDRLIGFGYTAEALDELNRDALKQVQAARDVALDSGRPAAESARRHNYVDGCDILPTKAGPNGPREVTYQQAVNEALRRELAERPSTVVFGEDVGKAGGIFGCSRNLQSEFGEARVFDTPIAEAAILGSAVGASINGLRPIVEIMWADFSLVALDQLFNQAANVAYVTRGNYSAPMVVRMQQGATPGSCAQHSQSLEALMAHIPGLKIGLPSTPKDAYSMLRAAAADPNPVIIFESRAFYQTKGPVDFDLPGEEVGGSQLVRPGMAATLFTYGTARPRCEEAAEVLADEGIDLRLVDLRWLNPIDWDVLGAHVNETDGRAMIVHEANLTGGFGAEVAARLWERGAKKVQRVGAKDTRIPAAPNLQDAVLPSVSEIVSHGRNLLS
ncbi:thiamine pyrophosphate-dependent enzyme [Limibacillus sp. MBR-115]|uniref:alpha-ketoacid dehydrogenase subunit alpha/beta n=1 Tax=Limibacillus sp. MBR-115 TaxID=3156465 RepID=UPI0033916F8E